MVGLACHEHTGIRAGDLAAGGKATGPVTVAAQRRTSTGFTLGLHITAAIYFTCGKYVEYYHSIPG